MISAQSEDTYTEAVKRGDYDLYVGNLFGKYDNVRVYWEDQLTRSATRPFLSEIASAKRKAGMKTRIVDLGCGTGQGYEILTRINKYDLDLGLFYDRVLPENEIELYLGLDLSETMVKKGTDIYKTKSNVRFLRADLRDGLASIKRQEPPFDIYFSSYGSLSHLNADHLASLLKDICSHCRDGSLVVLDLIGRFSIEWPGYWAASTEEEKVQDYSMSYLHSEFGMKRKIEHFPIRFWTGAEVDALATRLSSETDTDIQVLKKFDRSLMVGRHVDTREYNERLRPIRRTVNRLHEDYMRTDLSELKLDRHMVPRHPDPQVTSFFEGLITDWNTLVDYCQKRLRKNMSLVELTGWSGFSAPLQFALMTIDRVINSTEWMWYGDPRANIIEPQLGYALRSLESNLQRGLGCGHGMLVFLEIRK